MLLPAAMSMKGQPKHVSDPNSGLRTLVSFVDISCAYFCASAAQSDPTCVELPRDGSDHGVEVELLLGHMCGTRNVTDGWHCEYTGELGDLGFEVGEASACGVLHRAHRLRCSVHGDDFMTSRLVQGQAQQALRAEGATPPRAPPP